eukprot:scpid63358/ scgid8401/ 
MQCVDESLTQPSASGSILLVLVLFYDEMTSEVEVHWYEHDKNITECVMANRYTVLPPIARLLHKVSHYFVAVLPSLYLTVLSDLNLRCCIVCTAHCMHSKAARASCSDQTLDCRHSTNPTRQYG